MKDSTWQSLLSRRKRSANGGPCLRARTNPYPINGRLEGSDRGPVRNPLKGCDPKTIEHFTKNFKFKHGGLAHADYSNVDPRVSYIQFAGLWGRFGLGMGIFYLITTATGVNCKGTCEQNPGTICTRGGPIATLEADETEFTRPLRYITS